MKNFLIISHQGVFFCYSPGNSHEKEEEGEEAAQAADDVAVDGVDGFLGVEIEGSGKVAPLPPCGALDNVAPLVDEGTDACIGTAGNAAAVLNGPQTGIIEMLLMARSVTPPTVIGNYGHNICTVIGPLAEEVTKYRLVTDSRSNCSSTSGLKESTFRLRAKIAYASRHIFHKLVHKLERTVL